MLLGWDIDGSFLNGHMALQRALSGWTFYQGLGANNAPFSAQVPLFATEALLEALRASATATQWIVTGVVLALLPVSMVAYTAVVYPRKFAIRLIAPIAVFFNLYVAVSNNTNPYLHFNAAMAAGPLIAAIVISLARRRSVLKATYLVLAAAAVSITGSNVAGAAVAILSLVVFTLFGLVVQRIPVRRCLFPLSIYLLLNCFWILPVAHYFAANSSEVQRSQYAILWGDSTLRSISEAATTHNWLRLVGTWEWVHADAKGQGYTSFSALYDSNPLYNLLSFLLLALASVGALLRWRTAWPFAVFFLITWFLMKGTAPPFGAAYMWLYQHTPGFKVFRNPYTKFGIGTIPSLAILSAIGVDALQSFFRGWKRAAFVAGVALAIAASIQPYWTGKMFKRDVYMQNYYVRVPSDYYRAAEYLNEKADPRGRALVFPFFPNLSYSALNWNFVGPDPLRFLVSRPTIFEANGYADPFVAVVFSGVNTSADELLRAVDRADIHYVLVHRDMVPEIYGADRFQDSERLLVRAGAKKIRSFGQSLDLYQFPLTKSAASYHVLAVSSQAIAGYGLSSKDLYAVSRRATIVASRIVPTLRTSLPVQLSALSLPAVVGIHIGAAGNLIPSVVNAAADSARPTRSLFLKGQIFSDGISGDLFPGAFPAALLAPATRMSAVPWRNVDSYAGPPSSQVYRVVPIYVNSGDHVYSLQYRALSLATSVGVSIRCCYPHHNLVLSKDLYLTLDGRRRAVGFRISVPRSVLASLCIFGNGAGLIAASPARIVSYSVKKEETIVVPETIGVPATASTRGPLRLPFYSLADHFNGRDAAALAYELKTEGRIQILPKGEALPSSLYRPPSDVRSITLTSGFPYSDQMTAEVTEPGVLILSEAWNKDWIASAEGQPLQKVLADGVFDGWQVQKAERVQLTFWPRILFFIGAAISLAAALLVLFVSLSARRCRVKIAIDARFLRIPRGIGNYVHGLLTALSRTDSNHTFTLYLDSAAARNRVPNDGRFRAVVLQPQFYPYWEQVVLPRAISKEKFDVLHCPGNTGPISSVGKTRLVLTVHDVIYLLRQFDGPKTVSHHMQTAYYRAIVPRAASNAALVLTDSRFSRADIVSRLHVANDKVSVIHLALARNSVTTEAGARILSVAFAGNDRTSWLLRRKILVRTLLGSLKRLALQPNR